MECTVRENAALQLELTMRVLAMSAGLKEAVMMFSSSVGSLDTGSADIGPIVNFDQTCKKDTRLPLHDV